MAEGGNFQDGGGQSINHPGSARPLRVCGQPPLQEGVSLINALFVGLFCPLAGFDWGLRWTG